MIYPDGPTDCADDPDCDVYSESALGPLQLTVYVLWTVSLVSLACWYIYRQRWVLQLEHECGPLSRCVVDPTVEGDGLVELKGGSDLTSYGTSSLLVQASDESRRPLAGELRTSGFIESNAGYGAFCVMMAATALFLVMWIGLNIDKAFFFTWLAALVWNGFFIWNRNELRNWFRLPVPLSCASLVHVQVPILAEVMVANPSALLSWWMEKRDKWFDTKLEHVKSCPVLGHDVRYIEFECSRLLVEGDCLVLPSVPALVCEQALEAVHEGLDVSTWRERKETLGDNRIAFEVQPVSKLVQEEVLTGFYLYQVMMYAVWIWDSYIIIGLLLLCVVFLSASINVYLAHQAEMHIAEMTSFDAQVRVKRSGQWQDVGSADLAPGDLLQIESNWTVPCDVALVRGSAVCDEAGLTGESMPVGKVTLPNTDEAYSESAHKASTLFGGTMVLQAGERECNDGNCPLGVVISTGIHTNKGQLISSILHPVPMRFKYDEELTLVFLILFVYGALFCFPLAIIFLASNGATSHWVDKWAYGMFTISQVLSPMLPIALLVGQNMASSRLEQRNVFCLDPKRIAIAGKIRVFCFDKTGTLTKQGLDFLGVQEVLEALKDDNGLSRSSFREIQTTPTAGAEISRVVASCHNLKSFGGQLVGNQVEVKMFEASGAVLTEDSDGTRRVQMVGERRAPMGAVRGVVFEIVKTFEFEHTTMTMSVVVRNTQTGECAAYCKGAPERIEELCVKHSVPQEYRATHMGHALQGCYVIGAAMRVLGKLTDLQVKALRRNNVEKELRNELKEDTAGAISALKRGDVRVLMLTGDNAQCAAYIARQCGMIEEDQIVLFGDADHDSHEVRWSGPPGNDTAEYVQQLEAVCMGTRGPDDLFAHVELAVTQKALDVLISTRKIRNLLLHIRIFARLRPDGKVAVIEQLWQRQLIVGIALSDAEASVVSPFTSTSKSVHSVVHLLSEGRCALATNFATYKFLITYGQLFSLLKLMCFYVGVFMCQLSYLMIDAVAVLSISYMMTLSPPSAELPPDRPTHSLFGTSTVASIMGAQVGAFVYVTSREEATSWPASGVDDFSKSYLMSDNWEVTVIYCAVYSFFITSGVSFTYGHVWRAQVYRNWGLGLVWISLFGLTSYLLLADSNAFTELFHIASRRFDGPDNPVWKNAGKESPPMSKSLRFELWIIIVAGCVCATLWEKLFVLGPLKNKLISKKRDGAQFVHLRL